MRIVQKKGVQKLQLRKRQLKQKQAGSASSAAAFEFISARRHVAVADHIKTRRSDSHRAAVGCDAVCHVSSTQHG